MHDTRVHFFKTEKALKIAKWNLKKYIFDVLEFFQKLSSAVNKIHLQRQETAGDNLRQNHQKEDVMNFLFHAPTLQLNAVKLMAYTYFFGEMQWCTVAVSLQQWGKGLLIGKNRKERMKLGAALHLN